MHAIGFTTVVNILNILLLFGLLYIYFGNYKKIKSKFCLGLIIFAFIFFLENLVAVYFQTFMSHCYSIEVSGYILIINLLEFFGIAALLYITLRPEM